MKKILIAFAAAIFVFASCSKTESPQPKTLKLNLTVNHEGFTKAVKTGWESGDIVYVFFGKPAEHPIPAYLTLTYNGSSWAAEWTSGLEEEILATTSGTMSAAYVPGGITGMHFISETPRYNFTSSNYCYYLKCENAPYTVSSGVLNGVLNMTNGKENDIQFFLEGEAANATNLTFSCSEVMKYQIGSFYTDGTISWGNVAYDYPIKGMPYKGGAFFSGSLKDVRNGVAFDYTIKIVDNKGTTEDTSDDKTYTLTKNRILKFRGAYKLPALSSGDWTVTP